MKKVLSFLLVAMLIVTCFATMASAAGAASAYVSSSQTVAPGQTVTLTVGVSGDEFANYEMNIGLSEGLTLVSIDGVVHYGNKVAWASNANVTSHGFTITVKVADDAAPGNYYVSANVTLISDRDLVDLSCSNGGATLTIEEPACEHSWDKGQKTDATCTEDGQIVYTCILCGETRVDVIPAKGHDIKCSNTGWEEIDNDYHGHTHACSRCGVKADEVHKEIHTLVQQSFVPPTETEWGTLIEKCPYCGYERITKYEPTPEPPMPPTGDITSVVNGGTAAILVSMMSMVGLIVKRKTV